MVIIMKKTTKTLSVVAVSLCLCVCSHNWVEDVKNCDDTVTTYNKNMKIINESSDQKDPKRVQAVLDNHSTLSKNADACLSAYSNSKMSSEERTSYLAMSFLGYIQREDSKNSLKVCELISSLRGEDVVILANKYRIYPNCSAKGIEQTIKSATVPVEYSRSIKRNSK